MERTAQNRVIFGANAKKEKSRNPHGYWIFRWRRVWDSNPRALADNRISSAARYDHFDNSPSMFSRRFSSLFFGEKRLWKELTERTANYSVFRTVENPHGYKVSAGRNGQLPARFRVLHLRPLGQLSVSIFVRFSFQKFAQKFVGEKTGETAKNIRF